MVVHERLNRGQQAAPVFGQRDAARRTRKECEAGLFFQCSDGVAYTGLRVVHGLRALCDIAALGDLQEDFIAVHVRSLRWRGVAAVLYSAHFYHNNL